MTVVNHNARDQYIATLGQTIFNYTFEISANTNINVYQRAAGSEPNDAADILTLTTDYTVTGVGNNNGGTIVLVSGAALNDIITIEGNAPPVRSTSFTPGGVIQAQNLNLEFDNGILIYQTIMAILGYLVPKYPQSAIVDDFERVLPNLGANESWQMNADRDEIIAAELLDAARLASHTLGLGASMVGLNPVGTVQDFANAPFILKTANATTPNAQSIGALGSGILKGATGSGVISISNPLTSLDLVSSAANMMPYYSDVDVFSATSLTPFARTLLDDINATTARATLGVPSTLEALLVANNLSDLSNFTNARANLGVAIGTDVQAYNINLQAISALGTAANKMIYTTGVGAWAETQVSSFSRTLFDEVDAAAWRAALDVGAAADALLRMNNLSDLDDAATARVNLGVEIGVNVQAYDATLQSLSALGTMADKYAYTTGVDTWAEGAITALGRTLLANATQADMNTTIGSLPLAGGTMTGNLILNGPATTANQAVTLSQLNSVILNEQLACNVATTADMPTWTYNNGASGVGATLTAPINGATTFDGVIPTNGQRVLVLFQTTNPAWQGAYTIVQGTGGTPTVLTRAVDWDEPGEMNPGDIFSVVQGTTWGASQWMFSQTAAITIGTTALTFTQLVGQGALLKANNLSDLPSALTARANLGLTIGTNVQAYDATLQSLSALGTAADRFAYTTGVDTWAEAAITSFGRSLVNIAGANSSVLVTSAGGVPSMSTDLPTAVTIGTAYIYRVGGTDVAVADGGTGLSALTAFNLMIGTGTSAVTLLAPSATSGIPLVSQGAAANPAYSTAVVAGGGTGLTSTTAYGLLAGGTTSTGNLQNIGAGAVGQIPVSNGSAALPTFAAMQINKNMLIGGNFSTNPWQRGTTFAAAVNNTYQADRWALQHSTATGVMTVQKTVDSPTTAQAGMYVQHCLDLAVTTTTTISAGSFCFFAQRIEGYVWQQFAGRPLTISFWVKATVTGTYCVTVSADQNYVAEYTISSANTWEFKTVTISAISANPAVAGYVNTIACTIIFAVAVGSTFQTTAGSWQTGNFFGTSNQVNGLSTTPGSFKLSLVKMEPGLIATPFELETEQQVLTACQRYYRKSYSQGTNPATNTTTGQNAWASNATAYGSGTQIAFHNFQTMRAAPTVTVYSTTGASGNIRNQSASTDLAASAAGIGDASFCLNLGATVTANNQYAWQYAADAEL
jgi:hypothetical protein